MSEVEHSLRDPRERGCGVECPYWSWGRRRQGVRRDRLVSGLSRADLHFGTEV